MKLNGVSGWVLAGALCCAGLASAQPAQPPPTPAPGTVPAPGASAAPLQEPTLPEVNDPLLEAPPAPSRVLRSWQEAIAILRQESTSLRTSRARIQQAEAQARLALSPALPTLTGQAGVTHYLLRGEITTFTGATVTIPDPATQWGASLDLRVPLFAPEAWFNHGTAKDAITTARLDAKEIERQQVALVANAIVSLVTAERVAEVSRVALRSALSTLDLNKRRAALGASSSLDVLRVEAEAAASRAQLVLADEELARARETLGLALGTTEAWGVTNDIRLDALANDARVSCVPETTIEARPDVRAARSAVEVAERDVRGAGYSFIPRVDAVSSLGYSQPESGINNEHLTWTVGAVLNWNIYDGGVRYGTRDLRRAEASLQRERLTDTKRRAALEVAQSIRGIRVSEASLRVASNARDIAAETARLAKVAYLNGSGTSFDLVDTAQRLREAEITLAIREFELLRAKIAALLALSTCRV